VRELEAKYAVERKKLIQAIAHYLGHAGVQVNLRQEPASGLYGISLAESVLQLKGQRIDSIRLIRSAGSNCADGSELLRFQFEVRLEQEIPAELIPELKVRTRSIKTGKVLGIFGGKITEVKWAGDKLAEILNQDTEICETLLQCSQIWGEMELEITAEAPSEVYISGPWFVNPKTIISLYSPDRSYEEQNCVFSYKTADRIGKLVREMVLSKTVQGITG